MKKIAICTILIGSIICARAQDPTVSDIQKQADRKSEKDSLSGWRKGGVFALNLGQGNSKNWAAGAEEYSFAIGATLSVFANKRSGRFYWNNALDLGYGMINTHSNGSRKTDDKIDLFSKAGHHISETFGIAGVVNFRSQFTDGYDYDYLEKDIRRRTSSFMAPAYLSIAPGVDWIPTKYFSVFFSPVAVRMVIVTNDPKSYYYPDGVIPTGGFETPLSVLYGVDPQREIRTEFGGFLTVNFSKEIFKNVAYKTRLDLYSNFLETTAFTVTGPDEVQTTKGDSKPQNIDVVWTNLIAMKINKYLTVTYNFDLLYDDDVRQFGANGDSPGTQIRSLLAVGLSLRF
jgi:Protein of unknown function (DUF3078)